MAPSSCLLTGSPDSEHMVQTFLKKSFLIANLLLLAFGLNASLAPNIFFLEEGDHPLWSREGLSREAWPYFRRHCPRALLLWNGQSIWLTEHKVKVPLPTLGPL